MTKTLDDFAIAFFQGKASDSVGLYTPEDLASDAYDYAEAMMKESRKRRESQEQRHTVELTED